MQNDPEDPEKLPVHTVEAARGAGTMRPADELGARAEADRVRLRRMPQRDFEKRLQLRRGLDRREPRTVGYQS